MVTRFRPRDGSESLSLRFAFVSICAAGLLLLGLPAQAQRQVLQTRSAALPKARPVRFAAANHASYEHTL